MPLRDDLLQPIAGDNPSGRNLKYDRVFDQIKEARTEEDTSLPAGAWERQAKRADYNLVIRLAGETLATKTKDLQLAAWLGEAHIKREGATLIAPVLGLLLALQREFWPTLYPELDEEDAGLRAVPLQWAANRYATLIYELPLTKSGTNYHGYKAARALGYEADSAGNDGRQAARLAALNRGQLTAESVDDAVASTPKSFYADLEAALQAGRETLEELALYCEEQYGDDGPGFRKLRDSLDEVHNVVTSLLNQKRSVEPDVCAAPDPAPEPELKPAPQLAPVVVAAPALPATPAPAPAPAPVITAAPATTPATSASTLQSWDDAASRVQACAAFMHAQRPGSAVPYLLQTAIRWGELRKHAPKPPLDLLVAPPADIRAELKQAFADKAWGDLLSRSMAALGEPYARAWLDVHRYIWKAAQERGFAAFARMVVVSLQGLLSEFPDMPSWAFADDTPVANGDTVRWIEEEVTIASAAPAAAESAAMPATAQSAPLALTVAPIELPAAALVENEAGAPDLFAEAAALAMQGQLGEATALLARDSAQQASGRMRYQRRLQIAELCLASGKPGVALPILRELIAETERRNLESWESGEMIAKPLALLLRSQNGSMTAADRDALFSRLCRIDPTVALAITP